MLFLGLVTACKPARCMQLGAPAGCDCLPIWTYTSSTTGQTYNITNGTCQNPGGDWSTDWCYVNPLSCAHRPFLANGPTVTQAWDTCSAPNLNKTIDSGARPSMRQTAVMGVVWRPGRAVLRLVHACTRCVRCLTGQTLLSEQWFFCAGRVYNMGVLALGFMPPGALPARQSVRAECQCGRAEMPGLTVPAVAPARAEKTLNYCNCMSSYEVGAPNGTILATNGECIQDDPSRPPWCYVDKATCSVPPPVRNGSAWDYCRGAPPLPPP